MNRHILLDVYLGLRADALRAVAGVLVLSSAAGTGEGTLRSRQIEEASKPTESRYLDKDLLPQDQTDF